MRFQIFILALFSTFLLDAQSFNEQLLIGSWKSKAYIINNNDTTFYNGLVTQNYVMTFYPDSAFQEEQIPVSKTDTTLRYSAYCGQWVLVDKAINITKRQAAHAYSSIPMSDERMPIVSLTDTVLVVESWEGRQRLEVVYTRLAMRNKINKSITISQVSDPNDSLETIRLAKKMILVQHTDNKQVVIPMNASITINFGQKAIGKEKRCEGSIEGYIYDINDSQVVVSIYELRTINYDENNDYISHTNYRFDHWDLSNDSLLVIPIDSIKTIYYKTDGFNTRQAIGGTLITLGLNLSLIFAPIFSIDYSKWEMRNERYFKLAGTGLALTAASIPLIAIGRQEYLIVSKSVVGVPKTWFIKRG
ncbi:MAG: hypothetical protein ACRCYO_00040 [Bacteroidia bacterium]